MKGGKALLTLQQRVANEAPLATLQASGRSSITEYDRYAGNSRSNHDHYTWKITTSGVECWPTNDIKKKANITSRYNYLPDVPPKVLSQLKQQCDQAVAGMDGFYQAALQSLAPQLVMQALDGKRPSWSKAFTNEVNHIQGALSKAVRQAHQKLPDRTFVEHRKTMHHNGQVLGTMLLSHNVGWYQGADTTHEYGSPTTFYIALPEIAQEVAKWVKIIELVAREAKKDS